LGQVASEPPARETAYRFKPPGEPSYHARQIANLIGSIRTGRRPTVDGYEGKKSVAIFQAVYESNRTGQPVRLQLGEA
jgi:predicted dehydrogenase